MSVRTVKLKVITDFVCASCFIGYHELFDAIAYCTDTLNLPLDFEIEHIPYRLISPTVLPEGTAVNRTEFLLKNLGQERLTKTRTATLKWGEEKGVPIKFDGLIAQSTLAHRLCLKAARVGGQARQIPLMRAIFTANIQEGKNIGDINLLAQLAASASIMTREEAIKFLKSDELAQEVETLCAQARAKGITGVPVTVIDCKWAVNGGQCSDVFVQIFKKLASAGPYNPPSPFPGGMIETAIVGCPSH